MDENKFKKIKKLAACTRRPWEYLIPSDIKHSVIAQVNKESIDIYGRLFDECNKRKICFTKDCMGRELEWNSPTAKPYLAQFAIDQGIEVGANYYVQTCEGCPIAKTCSSPCYQINDYLNRSDEKEPNLIYQESLDNHIIEDVAVEPNPLNFGGQIPWDCLSEMKQFVVKKYVFEQKDFLTISKELLLTNQAQVKYIFYSALTKLSEFGAVRQFIDDNKKSMDKYQYKILNYIYNDNKSLIEVAQEENISKQAVQQLISRLIKKYDIKWTIFVKKQGTKLIYNVPSMLK